MSETGIVTLAFYNNFGSVLQGFALQKKICKITGGTADLIPFRPNVPEYTYFQSNDLLKKFRRKCDKFDEFRSDHMGINGKWRSSIESMEKQYDTYVAGSDIIWGREFSGLDPAYFLDFVPKGKRKISYAASMVMLEDGHSEDDGLYRRLLPNFDFISVRESSNVQFVQQFTSKKVVNVLDPTFLLEQKEYLPIVKERDDIPDKPYLLSYFLTHDPAVVDYTNLMAKKMGLKVVHYFADYPKQIFDSDAGCFAFCGPKEFLGYVKNASCIFTNSFHGTCFSVIFHRPFYTYTAKRAMLSRVNSLMEVLGLKERCFTDFLDLGRISLEIDYTEADRRIQREKERSLTFLKDALGGNSVV